MKAFTLQLEVAITDRKEWKSWENVPEAIIDAINNDSDDMIPGLNVQGIEIHQGTVRAMGRRSFVAGKKFAAGKPQSSKRPRALEAGRS